MRFLLSRHDNIGDLILALPVASLLKQHYPQCHITMLARAYTQDIVTHCPAVDDYLDADHLLTLPHKQAVALLKDKDYSHYIALFPSKSMATLAKAAHITHRIGTNRRLYHWWTCQHRVNVTRKRSQRHEAQLNVALLKSLNIPTDFQAPDLIPHIQLTSPDHPHIQTLYDPHRFNLILHPGSNGHGREWPVEHFLTLINTLDPDQYHIILTGTTTEQQQWAQHLQQFSHQHVTNTMGTLSLSELMAVIAHADGLVAASTGPLHIAAAYGIRTLGLYPQHTTIGPSRWAPLGTQAHYLTPDHLCTHQVDADRTCPCLWEISPAQVAQYLSQWILQTKQDNT